MIPRIVIVMLVAALTLPVSLRMQPGQNTASPSSHGVVAAKAKKHKGRHHKKHTKPARRTTVTRTFTSTVPVTIPNAASGDTGPADPYPSDISVSGFRRGKITDVNLILTDLTHTTYADLDFLLSSSDGRQALVMSDIGDDYDVLGEDIDFILDDEAAAAPPVGQFSQLRSGTFRPTNHDGFTADPFAAPAPIPDGNVALRAFDGADPNGTWQLWIMDNANGDRGDLGGWALEITAEVAR